MTTDLRLSSDHGRPWSGAIAAFLTEKQRRSGSLRTVQSYQSLLYHFFTVVGKTPDQITSQDVFLWSYGKGVSGKDPSANTISARIACISSFYRFLIRMGLLLSNPCDQLQRPNAPATTPRGLTAAEVRLLLSVVPETAEGLRDRALMLTLVLTGRRRAELMALQLQDLTHEGGAVYYRYRGKGGKVRRRELPAPAYAAIMRALAAWGKDRATMAPAESLWPRRGTSGISGGTFYSHLQTYLARAGLPPAGVHLFRHTAAKLRRDTGATIEEVSRFLDHSNLAVTTVYLQRLEVLKDQGWAEVAALIEVPYEAAAVSPDHLSPGRTTASTQRRGAMRRAVQ